jgi:multidrug efflux system outer membrane protein
MSERGSGIERVVRMALAGASVAFALAGCMSLAPDYHRPAAPVAPDYPPLPMAASAPASGVAAADVDWQRFFADERLKRLIALALDNSRDLRIAVLNIEQARATYDIRRTDAWPTVGVGINAQREPGPTGRPINVYAVGAAVSSWELDLFGRIRSLSDAALAQYFATAEARKAVQTSLIASIATTYFSMLADDELLRITQETLASREDTLRLTKLRFDSGVSSELEYRLAESLLESARATYAQGVRQRAIDEDALVLLVGRPLPPDLPAGLPLDAPLLTTELPSGLPSELLERRPDIRSAEQNLRAANANIGAAKAAFFPHIALTANFGTASGQLSGLFQGGTWAFTGTASALETIFDAGRNQANLDVARVNRDIAQAQYERTIQTAFREVADGLAGRATLIEQLRAQVAQANAEGIRTRLTDLRYFNGAASALDLLDARRSLFAAQQAVVQVRAAQVQNLVGLYRALGGGWTEPPGGPQP